MNEGDAFLELRRSLTPIEGREFRALDRPDLHALRFIDLEFGWHLGLVPPALAYRLTAARAQSGSHLDSGQRLILDTCGNDDAAVTELLRSDSPDEVIADEDARLLWLRIVLSLMLEVWKIGRGEPILELSEITDAWGDSGDDVWHRTRPRGVDALVFGEGARRRLLRRIDDWVSTEGRRQHGADTR